MQKEHEKSERSQVGNRSHNLLANRSTTVSHPQVGLKEVEDILREVDLNGDGLVDFEGKTRLVAPASCSSHLLLLLSTSSSPASPPEFVRMMSR